MGLRELKKGATRARIAAAAEALFLERGFDAVTVEEVAARAEVSPRTLFRYVSSKEELVFAPAAERVRSLLDQVDERPSDVAPIDVLFDTIATVAVDDEVGISASSLARIVGSSPSLRGAALELQQTLRDGLVERMCLRLGRSTDDAEVRLVVSAALAAMTTAVETWDETAAGPTFAQHLRSLLDRLRTGLDL